MTLSETDAKLFYELWFPLLDYVNEKRKINKKLGKIYGAVRVNPEKVKEIANSLWEKPEIIDSYLVRENELSEEHRRIISGWKRCVTDDFYLERHLKKGSIFISSKEDVYQVSGIITSWEDMFWYREPPILMKATLIPFKDVIITDGLVFPYNVVFGSGLRQDLKDTYMIAKKNRKIQRTL